jgi:hypothetical protein
MRPALRRTLQSIDSEGSAVDSEGPAQAFPYVFAQYFN